MNTPQRTYVIKASAAIALEAKHPITLKSLQIFDILLAHAYNALGEYTEEISVVHTMPLADLYAALDGKISAWSDLKPHLQHLRSTAVQWNILGKIAGIEMESSPIAEFGRDAATDELIWSYPPMLARLLYEPKMYSKLSLHELAQIGSKPHHRLFQLVEDYKYNKHGTGWIRIGAFQRLMGTKYPRWDNIKKRLIDEPIARIHEQQQSYLVSYALQRSGKKIIAVKFTTKFTTKPTAHSTRKLATKSANTSAATSTTASAAALVHANTTSAAKAEYEALFVTLPSDTQADIMARSYTQIPDFVKANYTEADEAWQSVLISIRNQILDAMRHS
jgi:Initiator Replication protein